MGTWLEVAVVAATVGAALAWAVRKIWRNWKKGTVCQTCGDAGNCPLAGKAPGEIQLHDLTDPGAGRGR